MKRAFWLAMGLGAGVTGAVMLSRWMRRQQERLSPANIGAQMGETARDLGQLVRTSLEEGREEMRRVEAEIRSSLDQ
ncbi:MAG TPA: hypothetical protein VMP42_07560 [Actinomycetota bacterium]|nr:hypothetical protein [Actinomycetota bacterium]